MSVTGDRDCVRLTVRDDGAAGTGSGPLPPLDVEPPPPTPPIS